MYLDSRSRSNWQGSSPLLPSLSPPVEYIDQSGGKVYDKVNNTKYSHFISQGQIAKAQRNENNYSQVDNFQESTVHGEQTDEVQNVIDSVFMQDGTQQIYKFEKPNGGAHICSVTVNKKDYILAPNGQGQVEVIERG